MFDFCCMCHLIADFASDASTAEHLLIMSVICCVIIGKNFEKVCEFCHITLNKVTIFDDNGNITPGGVRIGM